MHELRQFSADFSSKFSHRLKFCIAHGRSHSLSASRSVKHIESVETCWAASVDSFPYCDSHSIL